MEETEAEKEQRLDNIFQEETENFKPRNRAERREYERRNKSRRYC